ncbi:MAG: sugar ABC transporter permease [Alphaproteobacteria bacterium]
MSLSEQLPAVAAPRRARSGRGNAGIGGRRLMAWAVVTPMLVGLIVFAIYPFIYLVVLSLLKANLAAPFFLDLSDESVGFIAKNFIGLDNFGDALGEPKYTDSLWRSVVYAFATTAGALLLGVAVAVLVDRAVRGRSILRTLILLPLMTPPVTVAVMWQLLLMPAGGWLNGFLMDLSILSQPVSFLGSSQLALPLLCLADVWQWSPFVALMTYAALQTQPTDIYEAARLDGASGVRIFRSITLPMLAPALLAIAVLKLVIGFKVFDLVFVLTAGGPGQETRLTTFHIYQEAIQQFDMGAAAAQTLLFAVMVGLITVPFTIAHDVAERRLS